MQKYLILPLVLLLSACASSGQKSEEQLLEEEAAEATDKCLADPNLALQWGECNVKKTLFDKVEPLSICQAKFASKGSGKSLMLAIQVKPDGKVKDVLAETPTNAKLEACLEKEIRKLQFASPPKGTKPVVYFPYNTGSSF